MNTCPHCEGSGYILLVDLDDFPLPPEPCDQCDETGQRLPILLDISPQNPHNLCLNLPIPAIPPHLQTEANIQAEFYYQCRLLNLNCVLEVSVPVGRLDILIFSPDWLRLLAIVECKKRDRCILTKQVIRYQRIGVPVHVLASLDSKALAISIQSSPFVGVSWNVIQAIPKRKPRAYYRKRDPFGKLQPPFHPLRLDESVNYKSP